MANIFMTGGTGFLGWDIVKELLKEKNSKLYLLARGKKKESAQDRINGLIKKSYHGIERKVVSRRIEIIEGDIAEKGLGIVKSRMDKLRSEIDTIYHSAALCQFNVPMPIIRKINVSGTKNVLDFALQCKRNGQFQSFNHISTIGVAGKFSGRFYEDDLDVGQEFDNTYEQSKFEAEKLVEEYRKKGLAIPVFRPGIIVGGSVTNEVSEFQILYQILHLLSLEIFDEIPLNRNLRYGFVPVDCVARAIHLIASDKDNAKAYHLVNLDTVSAGVCLDIAAGYFGFKKPNVVSKEDFNYKGLTGVKKIIIDFYMSYIVHKNIGFDTENFDSVMKQKSFAWPKIDKRYMVTIFNYLDRIGYIKRKRNI